MAEPLEWKDFLARLAALVPRPQVNLTRFHGLFAWGGHPPNSAWRSRVTPAGRGRQPRASSAEDAKKTPAEQRVAMTWARRASVGEVWVMRSW